MGTTFLLLAALIALLAILRGYIRANPTTLARSLKTAAGIAALLTAAYLLSRGVITLAVPAGMLGAWLLWGPGRIGSSAPASGNASKLTTDHLEVALDHDTGLVTGRVLKGMFANRRIESLQPAELALLWQDCRFTDTKSSQILEAYLDRVHPSWQADMARGEAEMATGPDGTMSEREALEILGLEKGAAEDDIRKAHRELMMRFHPDRGGSTYLASKINEAKTILLGE
jgi:hypothetical protein